MVALPVGVVAGREGREAMKLTSPAHGKGFNRKSKKGRKIMREAAKAPTWVRDFAASKATIKRMRRHREKQLGTFGAASECRIIMKDGVEQ